MTVYLYDLAGNKHEIVCYCWDNENERYVFYGEGKKHIVAVFQKDGILGFTVKVDGKE